MKTLRKLGYLLIFGSLLMLDSCLPTDEVVADRIPALTSGKWVLNSLDAGADFLNEGYLVIYEGDELTFFEDGTCTATQLKINGSGNWSFNSDQSTLTLAITYDDGDTRNESWDIITLTNSMLQYEFEISPNTIEMIYNH